MTGLPYLLAYRAIERSPSRFRDRIHYNEHNLIIDSNVSDLREQETENRESIIYGKCTSSDWETLSFDNLLLEENLKFMEKELIPLISSSEIAEAVKQLAHVINRDYAHKSLTIIGILKGSFIFLADLVREIQAPIETIEFLQLSSYKNATTSTGEASVLMNISAKKITGKHILVVEDIIDTGISTTTALELIHHHQPTSLKLCSLLSKPDRRQKTVTIDYLGFTIPDHFIVGYGLDFNQQYRQLPAIYYFTE